MTCDGVLVGHVQALGLDGAEHRGDTASSSATTTSVASRLVDAPRRAGR